MKIIALTLLGIVSASGVAAAKPAHPSAPHAVPLGHMQMNPKAWNYGMIHVHDGWEVTPKSGWYTFTTNLLHFGAAIPSLMAGAGTQSTATAGGAKISPQPGAHNHCQQTVCY